MEQVTNFRPKLRHNALFLQTEDGLFVTGEGAGFHVKGKSIARWITTLKPYMTGDYTLDQLCARLDATQREHVTRIMEMFLERGVLKNKLPEAPGILPEAVRSQFRAQIEYIDHFIDQPQEHFKKFRESSLLLYGAGESLKALTLFLIRNGLQALSIVTPDTARDYLTALEPEVQALQQKGCEVRITLVPETSLSPSAPLADYDVVVYCADNGSLRECFLFNQRCIQERKAFLAVAPFAGQALLGPFVEPGKGPCWLCAMMRLSANASDHEQAMLWKHITLGDDTLGQNEPPFLPVARRVGHGLGFELFKILTTCLPSEIEQGMLFQSLDHLESSRSPLVRHPFCPACSHLDPATSVNQLEEVTKRARDRQQLDTELYDSHQRLIDPRLGLFTGFEDEDFEQLPLKRTQITGCEQGSSGAGKLKVMAFSLDTPFSARILALKKAITSYTGRIPDTRGMILSSLSEMEEQDSVAILPEELVVWSGIFSLQTKASYPWMPAFSLARNKLVYVPAAAAYPLSPLNSQGIFERTAADTAAATTFDELLTNGLLSALAYEQWRALLHERSVVIPIDPDSLDSSDTDLHFLLQSARRFARPFALKAIVSDLPISAVVAHTTDTETQPITALALALSSNEAVKSALQKLVENFQILEAGDQIDSPIGEERIFSFLARRSATRTDQLAELWPTPEAGIAQVTDALLQAGRDVLFVHTTSADLWEAGSLISGVILLTRPAVSIA